MVKNHHLMKKGKDQSDEKRNDETRVVKKSQESSDKLHIA